MTAKIAFDRLKFGALICGAGLMGFFSRAVVEITLWFGTAETTPRKALNLIYPLSEHGVTYYVSAGELLLHKGILIFWLMFALGGVGMGKDDRQDVNRVRYRWMWIGAATMLTAMPFAHLVAPAFVAWGWQPN